VEGDVGFVEDVDGVVAAFAAFVVDGGVEALAGVAEERVGYY